MRREFPAKTRLAAWDRCGGRCEACTAKIVGTPHYDHVVPDAVGGEPTVANCQVLCRACHAVKTEKTDVPEIARSKRIRAKHAGIEKPKRGFRGWRNMRGEIVWKDRK